MRRTSLLFSYFGAACSIFEPERAKERLAWTKTAALVGAIESHFKDANADQRRAFVQQFINLDATDQAYDTNAWYTSPFSSIKKFNIFNCLPLCGKVCGILCLYLCQYVRGCLCFNLYACTTIVGFLFYALSNCK